MGIARGKKPKGKSKKKVVKGQSSSSTKNGGLPHAKEYSQSESSEQYFAVPCTSGEIFNPVREEVVTSQVNELTIF